MEIKEGDLLLMFSDGLSDNLHVEELLAIVDRASPAQADDMLGLMDPESVAKALALAAQDRSVDPEAVVPFTAAARHHGFNCKGGKVDDITVAAAWVVKDMHTAETATEAPREESPSQRHARSLRSHFSSRKDALEMGLATPAKSIAVVQGGHYSSH